MTGSSGLLGTSINALTSDKCLAATEGTVLLKDGNPVNLQDLLKVPGNSSITGKAKDGSSKEISIALNVRQPVDQLIFDSEAGQVFVGQPKHFGDLLGINNGQRLRELNGKIPELEWQITDANDQNPQNAPGGEYTAFSGAVNAMKIVKVTALNAKFSSCKHDNVSRTQPFTVSASPGALHVDPSSAVLLPGQTIRLTADALDQNNHQAADAHVDWDIVPAANLPASALDRFISLSPTTGSKIDVIAKFSFKDLSRDELRNGFDIRAKWQVSAGAGATVLSARVTIKPQTVLDFHPIKVKLEPMDDQTASDLFGQEVRKHFWVMRIRLTNNLRDDQNGRLLGASILVFSESMEMAVSLEKKFDKGSGSRNFKKPKSLDHAEETDKPAEETDKPKDGARAITQEQQVFQDEERSYVYDDGPDSDVGLRLKKGWTPVSARRDFEGFLDLNPEYVDFLIKHQNHPQDSSESVLNLRGSHPRPGGKLEVWEEGDDVGRLICRSDFFYRPYSYEIVLNTSTVLEDQSARSRVFRLAEAIGLVTSVVTSIAVPAKGSDLPLGLDKYRNILIPGFQKIWKDMSDTHRQNLVALTMKPIEEIPFGSEISKIVFFPRKPFTGLVRGHQTRISQVCPYYFHATAAILNNGSLSNTASGK